MIKCTILLSMIANSIAHMGSPHSPVDSPHSPKTDCSQFTCAKDCNDSCGWSSLFNRCLSGSITTINEINKGHGCLINPTTTQTSTSTATSTSTSTQTSTSTATSTQTSTQTSTSTSTSTTTRFLNNSILNNTVKLVNNYDANSLYSISKNNKYLESTLAISITTVLVCFIGMVIYKRRNKIDEEIITLSNNVINPIYNDNVIEPLYMEPVPLNERKNNSDIYNTIPEHIYNIGNNKECEDYLDITYSLAN